MSSCFVRRCRRERDGRKALTALGCALAPAQPDDDVLTINLADALSIQPPIRGRRGSQAGGAAGGRNCQVPRRKGPRGEEEYCHRCTGLAAPLPLPFYSKRTYSIGKGSSVLSFCSGLAATALNQGRYQRACGLAHVRACGGRGIGATTGCKCPTVEAREFRRECLRFLCCTLHSTCLKPDLGFWYLSMHPTGNRARPRQPS